MIDRDLAELYEVETKRINEQVKRNIQRFPERYCFQLSLEEKTELVAKCDRFASLKHSSSLPYAFTESGVAIIEGFGYEVVCIFEDGAFSF
ncbi:ORF6N domain-containing protein [Pedobacter ginsengisoli]|uniref:ORF6N domain-containing protein n=1 Tax=Pedobacter ginsengisoli TaxID=363852 RepID=UPI0032B75D32